MVEHFIINAVTEAVGPDGGAYAVRSMHGHPSHELHSRSQEATLLMLGHHRTGGFFDHLGGTGRALLRTADCPIEVVPISDPMATADANDHEHFLRA